MSSNVSWRGAIEVSGFPVNVVLYSRVKKQRNQSFRTLAPSGQPIKQVNMDPATDRAVSSEMTRKGVETSKGVFTVMTPEALEQIESGVKTDLATPAAFCPFDSIAWDLAIDRFAVRPDPKVPGSESAVNIVWNGLHAGDLVYVSQISPSGGHDAILAIYATSDGLFAVLLPFEAELYDVPEFTFTVDDRASSLFAQVTEQKYAERFGTFDHSAFKSEYRARRQAAIDAVIAGEDVEVTETPAAVSSAPDLMAVLAACAA